MIRMRRLILLAVKYWLVTAALVFFAGNLLPESVSAALDVPQASIRNIEVITPVNDYIQVKADLVDSAGIEKVRCYFRYTSSSPYVFAEMSYQKEIQYAAQLPYPAYSGVTLEYIILAVNSKGQIIVSTKSSVIIEYFSVSKQEKLVLFTEAKYMEEMLEAFAYSEQISIQEKVLSEDFGVLAGIYSDDQLYGEAVSGYFGAFTYNEDGSVLARRGFVISLPDDMIDSLQRETPSGITATVDVSGDQWVGEFYNTDNYWGTREDITASITQNANSIVVVTTSKEGIGHRLVGAIDNSNHMLLYDDFDDEDWTTHYGPATTLYLKLADYIADYSIDPEFWPYWPLNVIELSRDSADPVLPLNVVPPLSILLLK